MTKHFLTLNGQGLLDLAIGIEDSNVHRYREWADRFRPFNEGVSLLFEEIADEGEKNSDDLCTLHGEQYDARIKAADPHEIDTYTENAKDVEDHFFVIDNTMARSILTAALHTTSKVRYVYKRLLKRTIGAALDTAYESRSMTDDGHIRRLKKFLRQFKVLRHEST